MAPNEFGRRLRYLRNARGASLQLAADAAGITKSQLWELEQGRTHNPRASTLIGLAIALGATPGHLIRLIANDLAARSGHDALCARPLVNPECTSEIPPSGARQRVTGGLIRANHRLSAMAERGESPNVESSLHVVRTSLGAPPK